MLLVEFTINGTLHRISNEPVALDHWWYPFISDFDAPQYDVEEDYGGYAKLTFGSISITPDLFADDWPPPKKCSIVIKYTASTEALAITLVTCETHLDSVESDNVTYEIYEEEYTEELLTRMEDYDEKLTELPRAFGTVTHVTPVRLPDIVSTGNFAYHLGGLQATNGAGRIIGMSVSGSGTLIQTADAHNFSVSDEITVTGSVNFNNTYTLTSVPTTTTFYLPVTFPGDDSETVPLHANAYKSNEVAVYDDGVPIPGNVVIPGDGTFQLTASPVGEVTMTGTSTITTLLEFMTWTQGRLGITTLNSTNARDTSPSINYWADSQSKLVDFASEVVAYFTHLFYIKNDTFWLVDMLKDNNNRSINEFEYFSSMQNTPDVINQITAEWEMKQAAITYTDGSNPAHHIEDIKMQSIASQYSLAAGTTSTATTFKLVDSTATFVTSNVTIGMIASNTTDSTTSRIEAIDSETQLTLNSDVFNNGEEYVVGPAFSYGKDEKIDPFHDSKTEVAVALQNILYIMSRDKCEVRIPIPDYLPVPGEKISWTNSTFHIATDFWIRARELAFDLNNDEIVITGEGVAS